MSGPKLTVHHLQVGQGERIPWLLEELSIPYELKLYQRSPVLSPPELKALHPMGASPVLEDATDNPSSPLLLAESGAIVDYVIYKYANGKLALDPSHPDFANYLYWFHFSNSNLQAAGMRYFTARPLAPPDDPRVQGMHDRFHKAIAQLNGQLDKTQAYLAGDDFTAADIMTVWCFTTMRKFAPLDLEPYPAVVEWLKRCTSREAYKKAMGRSDPELDLEEGISVKGPEIFGPIRAMYGNPK